MFFIKVNCFKDDFEALAMALTLVKAACPIERQEANFSENGFYSPGKFPNFNDVSIFSCVQYVCSSEYKYSTRKG